MSFFLSVFLLINIEIETKLNPLTITMSCQIPWCCSPEAHQGTTKRGRNPAHPLGDRSIDSKLAAFITQQYFEETGDDQVVLLEGDRLCRTCYEKAMKQFTCRPYTRKVDKERDIDSSMEVDEKPTRFSSRTTKPIKLLSKDYSSSQYSSSSTSSASETTDEETAELKIQFEKNKSKDILNDIFRIVGVSSITDM